MFVLPIRIYYEDTDAGGVVYHANYLKLMDRARTEWLRALGFELDQLSEHDGVVFPVRSAKLEYLKPIHFNDLIEVTAQLVGRSRTSAVFHQTIRQGELTLCEGEVRLVCVDIKSFTPRAWPERLAARLAGANA
jgi:acyl-CoA thioester hydrolase